MATPRCGDIAPFGHCRQVIHIAVAPGAQHDGIRGVRFHLPSRQVSDDDAACQSVYNNQFQHFTASEQLNLAHTNLPHHGLVSTEQQLLAGLSARIKRSRNLSTAERSVRQTSAIFASERHALSNALINDVVRNLSEAVHVGFASSIVSALQRVIEQPPNAVPVVLVVLGRIDPALSGDRMGTTRTVLKTERLNVVTQFRQ